MIFYCVNNSLFISRIKYLNFYDGSMIDQLDKPKNDNKNWVFNSNQ